MSAGFGSFLLSMAGPIARQVMVSLGIGVVTFVGLNTAVSSALSSSKAAVSGLTGDLLQVAALAGLFVCMSVIAGGITAGVSMIALKRFTKI